MTTFSAALFLLLFDRATAQYTVGVLSPEKAYSQERSSVAICSATGANFGPNITRRWFDYDASGCALKVTPEDACSPFERADYSTCHGKFYAVVPIGNCSFSEKAYHVQSTASTRGFDALIVYNVEGKDPEEMAGGKFADVVKIPVVMVAYDCMENLLERFPAYEGYTVLIYVPLTTLEKVLSFIAFACILIFFVLIKHILRCCCYVRERSSEKYTRWAQMRKYRKLPTMKYAQGDQPDTCVICFEEFVKGEKLTVLPCDHMYHYKCIVPWLAENGKCPMCQRPVWDAEAASGGHDRTLAPAAPERRLVAAANPRAIEEPGASSSRAQIHAIANNNASTSSQGSSEAESSSSTERQVNPDAINENADTPQADNSSEESFYSATDDQRLLGADETRNEGASTSHGAVTQAARSFRYIARGRSTSSRRHGAVGVDNAAFEEEEGNSTAVGHEAI